MTFFKCWNVYWKRINPYKDYNKLKKKYLKRKKKKGKKGKRRKEKEKKKSTIRRRAMLFVYGKKWVVVGWRA